MYLFMWWAYYENTTAKLLDLAASGSLVAVSNASFPNYPNSEMPT